MSADPAVPPENQEIGYFQYLRSSRLLKAASAVSFRTRKSIFEKFMGELQPTANDTVVDIGVTPDTSLQESNYFEHLYPHTSQITATSIEDASNLESEFPGLSFVRTEGNRLPFKDGQFDIAFTSAVLEHVGDTGSQEEFVAEVVRISRRAFIVTPNRWFPVDFHTMVPLVHWLPRSAHQRMLRLFGFTFYSKTENLNLLSRRSLEKLLPPGTNFEVRRQKLLGMTSNLIVRIGGSVNHGEQRR